MHIQNQGGHQTVINIEICHLSREVVLIIAVPALKFNARFLLDCENALILDKKIQAAVQDIIDASIPKGKILSFADEGPHIGKET